MTPTRTQNGNRFDLLAVGRALAWLGCLFAAVTFSPAPLAVPFAQALCLTFPNGEGESRAPLEEDDDAGQHGKEANPQQAQRLKRQRRSRVATASAAWLAHLPHTHRATAGFHPPVCTPFARGATFPIRC